MKKLFISLVVLAIAISSCKKKPVNSSDNDKKVEEVMEIENLFFAKSACFGKCPQYNATIMPDGRVKLKGIANTSLLGTRILKLKPEVINKIMADLDAVKFFELDSIYDNKYVTDIPETSLIVTSNIGTKRVMSRYDAPRDLIDYYKYIHTELMVVLDAEAIRVKEKMKNMPRLTEKDKNPIKKGTDTKK